MSQIDVLAVIFNGVWEWAVIAFVGLLVFGRKLPHIARSLGSSINQFKAGLKDPVEMPKELDSPKDSEKSDKLTP